MKLIEVTDKKSVKTFHDVARIIYKDDKNWVCPLEMMVEDVFKPSKNKAFDGGEAIRWIIFNDNNKPIGRIAAFYNEKKANTYEQPTGGIGFFECINDQQVANKLFDTAKEWLQEKGMEAMDGPINFDENYNFHGLLVDGFMQQGFGMPYNHKYYQDLFKNYGFKVYFEQYSYHLDTTFPDLPDRFWKVASRVVNNPNYSFRHLEWNKIDKFANDFAYIYNNAWQYHEHFEAIDPQEMKTFIGSSKLFIDPEMVWFVYHKDEPISFLGIIPDLNQILKHLNGKINLFSLLKIYWLKWRKTTTRARAFVFGIDPRFQRRGVEAGIFLNLRDKMREKPWYNEFELSWAGDFNPKIISLYESTGAKRAKTHYTMRYLFDRGKPFHRAPILE